GRRIGARRVGRAGERDGRGTALGLRTVVGERRRRIGVRDRDAGRVLRVEIGRAACRRADGVGAVVVEGAVVGGRTARGRVGGAGEVAVVTRIGVVEAGGRVGGGRVGLGREGDGRGSAFGLRAIVRERRRGVGVRDRDAGRVLRV